MLHQLFGLHDSTLGATHMLFGDFWPALDVRSPRQGSHCRYNGFVQDVVSKHVGFRMPFGDFLRRARVAKAFRDHF